MTFTMPDMTEFAAMTASRIVFYPSVLYNVVRSRVQSDWNWYNEITPNVVLGALPSKNTLQELKEQGVTAVVTLNQPHELFVQPAEFAQLGFAHLWLRTTDYLYAPTLEELHRGVKFIAGMTDLCDDTLSRTYHHHTEHVANDTKVYVHCKAGRGRSTTLVLCWLVSTGMDVDAAWSMVLGKRPQVCLAAAQWAAVRAFAEDWALRQEHNDTQQAAG